MKIVHIGTADNSGGAARASFHLHQGLLRAQHASSMVVNQQVEQRPDIDRIGFPRTLLGKLCERALLKCETWTGLQYLLQPMKNRFLDHPFVRNADIIHLHNLHGNFFSFTILPALSKLAPLVWTLHDTWALTGHCSYTYDCDRWRLGCGHCPNLREYPELAIDTTAFLWRRKRESYRNSRISVVAPSDWLCGMVRASPLFEGCDVRRIPYGIDLSEFCPGIQQQARQELSIPSDATVIMVIVFADTIAGASRKGSAYFKEALRFLDTKVRPWLLVVGSRGMFRDYDQAFSVREVGFLPASKMHQCYVAADVFVSPTLADNLPLSLLEATASGTPSVAFGVGGVSDIVRHLETGYLAKERDARDLAYGIQWILSDRLRRMALSTECRALAEREYGEDLQVARYIDLYGEVLAMNRLHSGGPRSTREAAIPTGKNDFSEHHLSERD
ncbi:MAG TPA: glycosyltransferase family 4 protein [Nitrospiraceae bacterium]|nr:glycosyltransferase family 4 protein [Nitrospiraceae bacterium]